MKRTWMIRAWWAEYEQVLRNPYNSLGKLDRLSELTKGGRYSQTRESHAERRSRRSCFYLLPTEEQTLTPQTTRRSPNDGQGPRYTSGSSLDKTAKEKALDYLEDTLQGNMSDDLYRALKKLNMTQIKELRSLIENLIEKK